MPIATFKQAIKRMLPEAALALTWTKRAPESWLAENLPIVSFQPPTVTGQRDIEDIANKINNRGAQPLWEGYRAAYDKDQHVPWATQSMERLPDQVRTQPQMGRLFAFIAEKLQPSVIVEIGTAFGISARYWAAGLRKTGKGRLLTFDPNPIWHRIAAEHLKQFDEVEPILGTFEESVDKHLFGQKIQLAFVDAIHTDEFVSQQIEMIINRMDDSCIIVVDDIGFSPEMKSCWTKWASDSRVASSLSIGNRLGILEIS